MILSPVKLTTKIEYDRDSLPGVGRGAEAEDGESIGAWVRLEMSLHSAGKREVG